MHEQPKSKVNVVTPVTEALEMDESVIKRKQKENNNMTGGEYNTCKSTVDWKSLRY